MLGWATAMGQEERYENLSIDSLLSCWVALKSANWSVSCWGGESRSERGDRTAEMQTSYALACLLLAASWRGGPTHSVPGYCCKDGWGSRPGGGVNFPVGQDKTSDAHNKSRH